MISDVLVEIRNGKSRTQLRSLTEIPTSFVLYRFESFLFGRSVFKCQISGAPFLLSIVEDKEIFPLSKGKKIDKRVIKMELTNQYAFRSMCIINNIDNLHNMCGSGLRCRYSDLVPDGQYVNRTPMTAIFSAIVHTDSAAHPTSCTGSLSWSKSGRGVVLTTHQHPVPGLKKDFSYTSTLLLGSYGPF